MQERYFHVLIKVPNAMHTRRVVTENGEMFNAQEVEQNVIDSMRNTGSQMAFALVIDWKEFKSKSDYEQFSKTVPE